MFMSEENISQGFWLKNIDEARNYLIEEINRNELMSKKHKNVSTTLTYIKLFLVLTSTITWIYFNFWLCFFSWYCYMNYKFSNWINNWRNYKKYKSIIKEKKKKHDKIVLLAKSKLNSIEVLIFKALIDSVIIHDELVLINNVRKEYNDIQDEIKHLKT